MTVRAVDDLRRSAIVSRTVKRAKQNRKGLKGLGNCKVRGKRVSCSRG